MQQGTLGGARLGCWGSLPALPVWAAWGCLEGVAGGASRSGGHWGEHAWAAGAACRHCWSGQPVAAWRQALHTSSIRSLAAA